MGLFDTNKKYKIRTGAISSSKVQEKELRRKARKLGEDPSLIIPECRGKCMICPFKSIKKKLLAVQKMRHNLQKLKKYSKRGHPVAKAYAGTLMLAFPEFTPFMRLFRTPRGNIPFAIVGQNEPKKLIGIQHYDNQEYRLMTYLDIALKKKIFIYSTGKGMVCTGTKQKTPNDFVGECIKGLDIKLRRSKQSKGTNVYISVNLNAQQVRNNTQEHTPYLKILWKSADTIIAIDEKTLRNKKTHTVAKLSSLVAGPDIKLDYSTEVIYRPECHEKKGKCVFLGFKDISQDLYTRYSKYELTDHELVKKGFDELMEEFSTSDDDIILYSDHCFTGNLESFFDHMKIDGLLRIGLKAVLKRVRGPQLYRKKESPLNILSSYWADYGYWALYSVCGDREISKKLHKKKDIDTTAIASQLEEAQKVSRSQTILEEYPEFDRDTLSEQATIADNVAKLFKSRGKEDAIKYLDNLSPEESQSFGTTYAFLLVFEATAGREWKHPSSQQDVGEFLKPFAENLLKAGSDEYAKELQTYSRYTGSTKEIRTL